MRRHPYLTFFRLAIGVFLVAHIGFGVVARLWVRGSTVSKAVGETLYFSAIEPVGTAMLLAPFLLLGWMGGSLAKQRTVKRGMILFIVGAVVLSLLYLQGHIHAEQAMLQQKWTYAALSIGLLPFRSIPVLCVVLVIRLLLGRAPKTKESNICI